MGERVVLEREEYQIEPCKSGLCQREMPVFLSEDLTYGIESVLFLQKEIHIQVVSIELDFEVLESGISQVDYGARLEENEDEETVNLLIDFWLEGKDLAISTEWAIPGGINLSVQKMWLEKMIKTEKMILWFVDQEGEPRYCMAFDWDSNRLQTTIEELSFFDQTISEPLQ
ncbi:hypothetical protein SANA_05860 [Gottschalkiaceae bacterium SANA]|nr:hypothetical protein SANA_05860 [Gottschalkiaceae bacterium SANA]